MKNGPTIRKAAPGDERGIAELWKELMDHLKECDPQYARTPEGHKMFAGIVLGCINGENSGVFVAEEGGAIVGYCMCQVGGYPAWTLLHGERNGGITDLCVAGKHRRKGIGEALFRAARDWLRKQRARRIEALGVTTGNREASAFWREMGFSTCSQTLALPDTHNGATQR